ncbi:glycosyltransferase family 1 protein [Sphingobium sp. IP1]|uniref:glycosyltransferase family 4 protein n=1 Tax=Sphingobium sp. IP1 TaxID=2021637 RepID=UPI00117A3E67|nr:glycosyltransferase family 1 protein [Sphingobium sp. IP1]
MSNSFTNRELNVALLVNDQDKITGISSYTFSLLKALEGVHEGPIRLITTWSDSGVAQMGLKRAEVVHVATGRSGMLTPVSYTTASNRLLRSRSGAVLLSTNPMANFVCPVPQMTVFHDLYRLIPGRYSWHQRQFFEIYARAVLRASQAVISVSETTARDLVAWAPSVRPKLHVVGEGSQFEAEPSYDADRRGLLFVANVEGNKNVACLLEALRLLEGAGEDVEVRWIGRDRSGEVGRWLVRNGPLQSLKPLGVVDQATLASEYRRAGALVVTSTAEGFCLPVVEANGFGVPTILSDIPILREVGGGATMYFDPKSPADLAKAIRDVRAERELRMKLSAESAMNGKRYGWDKAAQDIVRIISGLK